MTDEQPKQEDEITPDGAVEVDEQDLDQASGGAAYLKYDPRVKIDPELEAPDGVLGANPSLTKEI